MTRDSERRISSGTNIGTSSVASGTSSAVGDASAVSGTSSAVGEANPAVGEANPAVGEANPAVGEANPAVGEANSVAGDANSVAGDASAIDDGFFHKPLFSKQWFKDMLKDLERSQKKGSTMRFADFFLKYVGGLLNFFHACAFVWYGVTGLRRRHDAAHFYIYGSPLASGVVNLIRYLNDADTLFDSFFKFEKKNIFGHCADTAVHLVRVLFDIGGLIYDLITCKITTGLFIGGLAGCGLLIAANLLLAWEEKKRKSAEKNLATQTGPTAAQS